VVLSYIEIDTSKATWQQYHCTERAHKATVWAIYRL